MDLLEKLNDAQREAVTSTEGYVRVVAGAGSGKTRALSHRFAYLVNEVGILPSNILCVTFTNKSANEMRQRIHRLTGDNDTGYISTFHGFCVAVLQEDSHAVGYPQRFLVLDNSDIDSMLAIVYEERGLTLRDMTYAKARDMIEILKCIDRPDYYLDLIELSVEGLHQKYLDATSPKDIIFYGYLYQQKKCFGLDYNDLIKFSLYIFEQNAEIRLKWQQRLEYIMIDEYQDIDALQYRLMCVLCGYHKNLFIVGDPDQTIYTWRGANGRFLLDFPNEFPGTKTVMMMQNYRSTPQILAVANSLIESNKHRIRKELIATHSDGKKVICHHAQTAEEEAKWIAGEIKSLVQKGVPYKDITLLYRAHYVTRVIEDVFLKEEIPYNIYSGLPFFERSEIKDALSYLRMIAYKDDLSFRRIVNRPRRNLGERRIKFLQDYADAHACSLYDALKATLDDEIFKNTKAERFVEFVEAFSDSYAELPISELLTKLLDKSGYEKMLRTEGDGVRLDNLAELKQSVYEFETTCGEEVNLEHYLSRVALLTASDSDFGKNAVKMMTVHTAKGLEFPHVFLCSMNEGVFPSRKTDTLEAMEEERRLAFVAITRAEQSLYITEAEGWNFDGSSRYPSRFILDIDRELLDFTAEPRESLLKEAREQIAKSEAALPANNRDGGYKVGQKVRHRVFGVGIVLDIDRTKKALTVKFEGIDTPRTISMKIEMERL